MYTREGIQVVTGATSPTCPQPAPPRPCSPPSWTRQGLTHVVFGDNAAGRIPPVNAEFFVTYRYGMGAGPTILAANAINSIANIPNVDLTMVTVTNKESPVGGTDPGVDRLDALLDLPWRQPPAASAP